MNETIQKVMEALRKNRMMAEYVPSKEDVVPLIKTLLQEGCTIGTGGSRTLDETGVTEYLRNGNYEFYDRNNPAISPEERAILTAKSATADVYFCSSNAVTEQGELYNVDGFANRVAAIANGPKKVIMVVGINKIVPDLDAAIRRVKNIAAPLNTKRLNCDTYCRNTGVCLGVDGGMTDGCHSPARICCSYLVSAQQRVENRIHVILVGESLGF